MLRKESYPVALIPNTAYKTDMKLENVLKNGNFYTQRRASCSKRECSDDNGNITEKAIGEINTITGMSVNLMGTPHIPEYGKWIQKDKARSYWDGKIVDVSGCVMTCEFDDNLVMLYLRASELEGMTFPYVRKFGDRTPFEKYANVAEIYGKGFSRTVDYSMSGIIGHLHRPTNMNYWHAEIWITHKDIKTGERVLFTEFKDHPEWKRKVSRMFKELIRSHASLTLPEHDVIPSSVYTM